MATRETMTAEALFELVDTLLDFASQAEVQGLHAEAEALRMEAREVGCEAEAALEGEQWVEANDRYLEEMAMMGEL